MDSPININNINNINNIINNIINMLEKNRIFNSKESEELTTSITNLCNNYIIDNIIDMNSPDFDVNLTKYLYEIHSTQLLDLYNNSIKYKIRHRIRNLIRKVKQQQYKSFYSSSFL